MCHSSIKLYLPGVARNSTILINEEEESIISFFFQEDIRTGFVRVLEILESPGILLSHFPGLESPGKVMLVLESPGNLLN